MPKGRGTIKNLTPGVRTTAALGSKPNDWFTPDWDKDVGAMQHRDRVDRRAAMGQKKTPIGRSTIKPGC